MSETSSHERAKSKAAGKSGKTEVPLKGKRRLNAASKRKATEIERSGNMDGLDSPLEGKPKASEGSSGSPKGYLQGSPSHEECRSRRNCQKHEWNQKAFSS